MKALHRLKAAKLSEEIEARLKGVMEPSVEKMREAIRKEIKAVEEKVLVDILSPKGKKVPEEQALLLDDPSKKTMSGAPGQPKEDGAREPSSEEGPPKTDTAASGRRLHT